MSFYKTILANHKLTLTLSRIRMFTPRPSIPVRLLRLTSTVMAKQRAEAMMRGALAGILANMAW